MPGTRPPKRADANFPVSLILGLALLLAPSQSSAASQLVVFAAAGGKPAVEGVCRRFEETYGVAVGRSYGGGGEILSKMILARKGDIYIAPEQRFMEKAKDERAIDPGTVKTLAYMVPVIAVKRGNPKGIFSLADLAKPGIRLAITRPETTLLGKYAPEIFQKAGLEKAIMENVVTHAADPNHLLSMLVMDQVDAGVVWHFYGTMASDKIETIYLTPEQLTGVGEMQIAITTYSESRKLAEQFVDFATSSEGKGVFRRCGYIVDVEELKRFGRVDQSHCTSPALDKFLIHEIGEKFRFRLLAFGQSPHRITQRSECKVFDGFRFFFCDNQKHRPIHLLSITSQATLTRIQCGINSHDDPAALSTHFSGRYLAEHSSLPNS